MNCESNMWIVTEANFYQKQAYVIADILRRNYIYHNLFITLLLRPKAETVLVKQLCYIQTKMHRFYRKITIYGHFSIIIICTFLGSIFKLCYTKLNNHAISKQKCIGYIEKWPFTVFYQKPSYNEQCWGYF